MDLDKELIKKEQKIEKLSDELSFYKKEFNEAVKLLNFQDSITHAIQKANLTIPTISPPLLTPNTEGITALLVSDLHIGEEVKAIETADFGNYDVSIVQNAMTKVAEAVIKTQRNEKYRSNVLFLISLGDIVSTNLHELLENTPHTEVDCYIFSMEILSQLLTHLMKIFPKIYFIGVVGNHGRTKEKKDYRKRYTNWDYILYYSLQERFRENKHVKFVIPKTHFICFPIAERNYLAFHGDDIMSYRGMPWYGIVNACMKYKELYSKKGTMLHGFFLGHFHSPTWIELSNTDIIINGSTMGLNDYSLGKLITGNPPSQYLLFCNQKGIIRSEKIRLY